jgi:hypothetical protein
MGPSWGWTFGDRHLLNHLASISQMEASELIQPQTKAQLKSPRGTRGWAVKEVVLREKILYVRRRCPLVTELAEFVELAEQL